MVRFCAGACAIAVVVSSAIAFAADDDAKACPGASEFARRQHELDLQRDATMGSVVLPKLQALLLAWLKPDQAIRSKMTPEVLADQVKLARLSQQMRAIDETSYRRIKGAIDEYGFPTRQMVGGDGSSAAFLLVQHQDAHPQFQQFVLEIMTPLAKRGEVDQQAYALLTDRVLHARNLPQRFGTQMTYDDKNKRFIMDATEDEAHLDQRRAELDMPPIAMYRCMLEQYYRGPAR